MENQYYYTTEIEWIGERRGDLSAPVKPGLLHYWKAGFIREFSDDAIEAIVDFFAGAVPTPFAAVAIEHLGGAVSRVGSRDTAFCHRDAQHSLLVLRMWQDPAESEGNIDWARRCYRAAEPFLKDSAYVNYLGDEGNAKIRAAYGDNSRGSWRSKTNMIQRTSSALTRTSSRPPNPRHRLIKPRAESALTNSIS